MDLDNEEEKKDTLYQGVTPAAEKRRRFSDEVSENDYDMAVSDQEDIG